MIDRRGDLWTGLALGAASVAMAVVAGLCFTFSVAVMPNLAGADDRTFVETTQRFNQNPVFPLTFTAALVLTAVATFVASLTARARGGRGGTIRWTVAGLVLYGMALAVTAGVHIPLNEGIDQAGDPAHIADLDHVRNQFEGPWLVANIPRTMLAVAAVAALARALVLHGRSTSDGAHQREMA